MGRLKIRRLGPFALLSFLSAIGGIWIASEGKKSLPSQIIRTQDQTELTTCFTPHQRCLGLVVREIDQSKICIFLQGYSFTSRPIAEALIRAHGRGVEVRVLLDKSQKTDQRSQAAFLNQYPVGLRIDSKPAIAHNKVILIDHQTTITGSYNWTKGAEHRNAENLLVIKQKKLTGIYEENFHRRWNVSFSFRSLPSKIRKIRSTYAS